MGFRIKNIPKLSDQKLFRECLAEFIGVFIIILCGNGSVAQIITISGPTNFFQLTFSWACGVFLAVLATGEISGGHLNPVVTICLYFTHNLPSLKLLLYIIAQFCGGFIGAATVYGVYRPSIINVDPTFSTPLTDNIPEKSIPTAGIFSTYPVHYINLGEAVLTEVIATFLLIFVVYIIAEKMTDYNILCKAFTAAMTVWVIGTSLGSQTGYAINPARDFGPRVFSSIIYGSSVYTAGNSYFWVPLVAPILGGFLAIIVFVIVIGFNEENNKNIANKNEFINGDKICNNSHWSDYIHKLHTMHNEPFGMTKIKEDEEGEEENLRRGGQKYLEMKTKQNTSDSVVTPISEYV